MEFSQGALAGVLNLPVLNSYQSVRQADDDTLKYVFGRKRAVDFFDLFGERKATPNQWYRQYERVRRHQKAKVTTAGAGAGLVATLALDGGSVQTYNYGLPNPPISATNPTNVNNLPVKVGDVFQIAPASGATAGNVINIEVASVNAGAGTFTAYPIKSTQSIPALSSATEIIYLFNRLKDGGPLAAPTHFKTTFYDNSINSASYRYRVSDSGMRNMTIWKDAGGGQKAWTPADLDEHLNEALDQRELMCLLGDRVTNNTLAGLYAETTPLISGAGLIPEMIGRSNIVSYSPITGPTYNWFRTVARVLDSQRAGFDFMFLMGHDLRSDISKMNLNELNGGLINIGNYSYGSDKYVDLDFTGVKVDGRTFHMKTLESFSDLQTLGAEGMPYRGEGMIFPTNKFMNPQTNEVSAHVRTRYLTDYSGQDSSLMTTYYDGFKQSQDGNGIHEMRVKFDLGIELIGAQHTVYVPKGA